MRRLRHDPDNQRAAAAQLDAVANTALNASFQRQES